MRHGPIAALVCALPLLCAHGALAYTRDRIAFVVKNGSTNPAAADDVAPLVSELLKKKKYDVVGADPVAGALEGDAAGIPAADLRYAAKELQVNAILAITVELFLDAHDREKGPRASPAIAMSARMFSPDGRVIWRNSMAVIAEEAVALGRSRYARGMVAGRRSRGGAALAGASGGGTASGEAPKVSAASTATEVLLWTMPRGTPSPEELAAMRGPPPVQGGPSPEAAKSTRFESSPDRLRISPDTARFPMRTDRSARKRLDRVAPAAPADEKKP